MIELLPAGSTFAGYQVDAVLARGGMGVVYLATELRPRRRIALKLIAPALAADPAYRERFLREVDALAALEHPNVVPMHAAGRVGGPALPGDAVPGRPGPGRGRPDPRPPAVRGGHRPPRPDRRRARRRPRPRHRPPRRHALEHPPRRPRHPLPDRLRPHEAGRDLGPDRADAGADGDAGLHGARAVRARRRGPGAGSRAGAAGRRLRPRMRARHAPDGRAAVSRGTPTKPRSGPTSTPTRRPISERVPGLPATLDAVVARAIAKDPAARFATPGALVAAARAALAGTGREAATSPTAVTVPAGGPRDASGSGRRRRGRARVAGTVAAVALVAVAGGFVVGAGLLVAGSTGAGPFASPTPAAAAGAQPTPRSTPRPTPDADAIADAVPHSLAHPGPHAARRCARERRPTSRLDSAPGAQRLQLGRGDLRDRARRARLLGHGHEGGALQPLGRRGRPPVPLGPVRRTRGDDGRRPLRGRRGGHRTLG